MQLGKLFACVLLLSVGSISLFLLLLSSFSFSLHFITFLSFNSSKSFEIITYNVREKKLIIYFTQCIAIMFIGLIQTQSNIQLYPPPCWVVLKEHTLQTVASVLAYLSAKMVSKFMVLLMNLVSSMVKLTLITSLKETGIKPELVILFFFSYYLFLFINYY